MTYIIEKLGSRQIFRAWSCGGTASRTEHGIAQAAGQIVPTQLAAQIVIFTAELLGHHPDTALCPG